ncbi:MAG: 2-nonaprenyl-3-methyl-6-methoxy,4-benzoquinol hydroxylase Coq7 [Pseudomonadota bacterium]|jgi:ubiquinone biosynthesis monooxygenase Coq7
MRSRSWSDRLLSAADNALRTLASALPTGSGRPSPAADLPEQPPLSDRERDLSVALMRVNHAGEVAAQALYQGQAMAAGADHRLESLLQSAAREEADHLRWCEERLQSLGGHTSILNPLWYAGAFGLGFVAGRLGGPVSLGFLSETERQVEAHLEGHLSRLPASDLASRAVVGQMIRDEADHGQTARSHGGRPLPMPVRQAMHFSGRVMTTAAHYL